MLDDDAGSSLVELLDTFQRGVRVRDVVVGQLLALELACRCNTRLADIALDKEGRLLVRILAVAHGLLALELHAQGAREDSVFPGADLQAQVVGDGTVVAGRMLECLDCQIEAGALADRAVLLPHLRQDPGVVGGVHHNRYRCPVLRRRP